MRSSVFFPDKDVSTRVGLVGDALRDGIREDGTSCEAPLLYVMRTLWDSMVDKHAHRLLLFIDFERTGKGIFWE